MATIEPRLMHLLNTNKNSHLNSNELPPLQSFSVPKSATLPVSLPSLNLETDQRDDQVSLKSASGLPSQQIPPFSTFDLPDDVAASQSILPLPTFEAFEDGQSSHQIPPFSSFDSLEDTPRRPGPAKLLSHSAHVYDGLVRTPHGNQSIRSLLDDTSPVESSSHSLRKILDDVPPELGISDDATTKKRHRPMVGGKEDFVQLPQPLKKQKSAQQVMPPIINGLHEPPPNAAVFPPISTGDFGNGEHPMNLKPIKDFNHLPDDSRHGPVTPTDDRPAPGAAVKTRRRTKPRRKWTEEETNHLLIGVSRHGVGKWTSILEDPDFQFNERTAGDLKDRFRTCCPDELRSQISAGSGAAKTNASRENNQLPTASSSDNAKRSLMLEDMLIGKSDVLENDASASTSPLSSLSHFPVKISSDPPPKTRKSRAHRKKLQDLVELGISGPFKKSHRRERRPFTEQDDKEILQGIHQYGPAWTKIQRDEKFNLSIRQPTDLRDRVRNKYPEIYAKIEKGAFPLVKDPSHTHRNSPMEPSVNMIIENSLTSVGKPGGSSMADHPQLTRTGSKDNLPKWPLQHFTAAEWPEAAIMANHGLEIQDHHVTSPMGHSGEMDISRLLLDDSKK